MKEIIRSMQREIASRPDLKQPERLSFDKGRLQPVKAPQRFGSKRNIAADLHEISRPQSAQVMLNDSQLKKSSTGSLPHGSSR